MPSPSGFNRLTKFSSRENRLSLLKLWHTVRYLRADQLAHQLKYRLFPPRLKKVSTIESRHRQLSLRAFPYRSTSALGEGRFRFLNTERDLGWPVDWTAPGAPLLWKYNLHYFDYLHQSGLERSRGLAMIHDWITGHPVDRKSVGWEPYPLSIRLVNWIKFLAREEALPGDVGDSLALQAHNLSSQIEYHLRGNHLWANGKALWFAGVALSDEGFASLGRRIILEELEEQFLPDGGHFELSPMYHSIVLEDLLDLINLCRFNGGDSDKAALPALTEKAGRALAWLEAVTDEGGRIPLLNDSAHGIATSYADLADYARALDIKSCQALLEERIGNWRARNASGYWLINRGPFRLIFDTALLGPDYLLGHAHCDMLQILLDCDGQNIITDTGVYEYQEGERRVAISVKPALTTPS